MNKSHGLEHGTVSLDRGASLYLAGEKGHAWRVLSGSIRLDQEEPTGTQFAGLAVAGDVVGAETLLFGRYTFSAHALSPCSLRPWMAAPETAGNGIWLQMIAAAERRMADLLALRCGKAAERIRKLLALMGSGGRGVALPRLRDIADITDLTVETVSRTVTSLSADGTLDVQGSYRVRKVREVMKEAL